MIHILWITALPNSYKMRFLNQLHLHGKLHISMLCGILATAMGHAAIFAKEQINFPIYHINISKKHFGLSPICMRRVLQLIRAEKYQWVQVPAELKFIPLIIFLFLIKKIYHFRLFSYNHAFAGSSRHALHTTRFLYRLLDRVIFYTEHDCFEALAAGVLPPEKAFFANNTLDHKSIDPFYQFEIKAPENPAILFIGRLIPNKRIDLLLKYYRKIKEQIPALKLMIIGDGPLVALVKTAMEQDSDIEWFGALSDEEKIAPLMKRADAVCNLGASGLSVMHSFMYGKPYIGMEQPDNGPECWYLHDGQNGLCLSGTMLAEDCKRIAELFQNRELYAKMCRNTYKTAQKYSVEAWIEEIECALLK